MISSYEKNKYGEVFSSIITGAQPMVSVELGVLHGYSTINIARGLRENHKKRAVKSTLNAYDIFEEYKYNHGDMKKVQESIDTLGLSDYVSLFNQDAFQAHLNYQDDSVDFVHIDLSNTGGIVRKMMEAWDPKMRTGGLIVFEGGTEERDLVDWMINYNCPSIKDEIEKNKIIEEKYVFGTYLKFPGLTVLLKKR